VCITFSSPKAKPNSAASKTPITPGARGCFRAIAAGKAAWLIEASDGAADGRRKLWAKTRKLSPPTPVLGVFSAEELGLALGAENVIHTAFLAGRAADRWAQDAHRLSGFCPLLPESWREEPRGERDDSPAASV